MATRERTYPGEGILPRGKEPAPPKIRVIERLTDSDLHYQPEQPSFVRIAADTLGEAGTVNDGYDADMLTLLADVEDGQKLVPDLDGDLSAAGFNIADFPAAEIHPLAADVGAFVEAGDGIANDLNLAYGGTPASSSGTPSVISPPDEGDIDAGEPEGQVLLPELNNQFGFQHFDVFLP